MSHGALLQPLVQQGRKHIRKYVITNLPVLASNKSDEFAQTVVEDIVAVGKR